MADMARAAHRRSARPARTSGRNQRRSPCRHAHHRAFRCAGSPLPDRERATAWSAPATTSTARKTAFSPASSWTSKATSAPCATPSSRRAIRSAVSSCATPTTCSATASTNSAWRPARAGCSTTWPASPSVPGTAAATTSPPPTTPCAVRSEQYRSRHDHGLRPAHARTATSWSTRSSTAKARASAEALNLRTRVYRHFDSAGVATNARLDANGNPLEAYDFKGNLLRSTRRLVSDYTAIPDWLLNPQLDAETFEGSTRYDALNRPIQSIAPHSSLATRQAQRHPAGVQRGQPAGAGGRVAGTRGRARNAAGPGG